MDQPDQVPWYEITEQLPGNSFCQAFKARRTGFTQAFVIKILKPEFARDARTRKKFEIEIKKASTITQPNLAPTYDYGVTANGLPYFVTDFIEGNSLASIIDDQGFLPDDEAIDIFIQICDALQVVHAGDMLHRDLKPANIMVTVNDEGHSIVKVTDTGIAKVLPPPQDSSAGHSLPRLVSGTDYLSPEQWHGEKLDARSDVYSLGCLMYHTLGGKAPHRENNHLLSEFKQSEQHPISLSVSEPDVSLALEHVVMRATQKDKEKRYQNIAELQNDLTAIRDASQAADWRRLQAEPALAARHESNRKYSRLFLLSIFLISIALTYTAQTLHNSLQGSSPEALATMPLPAIPPFNKSRAQDQQPAESWQPASEPTAYGKYSIYSADGTKLYADEGNNLGQVLESAVSRGVNLANADLKGQSLTGLNLAKARLKGARFENSDLTGTNFSHADLRKAQFSNSTMAKAVFDYALMENSIITDSELCGSRFFSASAENSRWRDCNLDDANLSSADFTGAQLTQVESPRATLIGTQGFVEQNRYPAETQLFIVCDRDGHVLYKSQIKETFKQTIEEAIRNKRSLKNADLRAVDLYEANLDGADLRNADLRGALLSKATLTNADLRGALATGVYQEGSSVDLEAAGVKGWQVLMQEEQNSATGATPSASTSTSTP